MTFVPGVCSTPGCSTELSAPPKVVYAGWDLDGTKHRFCSCECLIYGPQERSRPNDKKFWARLHPSWVRKLERIMLG